MLELPGKPLIHAESLEVSLEKLAISNEVEGIECQ